MVNMFVSAKCARALFNEKVLLVNIDGAALVFSGCHTRADHYAKRFAQLNRLSLRVNSRWATHARESRAAVDRPRQRFNSDEHRDTSLRNHHHAQDTRVRNAPLAVSVELAASEAGTSLPRDAHLPAQGSRKAAAFERIIRRIGYEIGSRVECLFLNTPPALAAVGFFALVSVRSRARLVFENATPELVRDARCTPMPTPTRRLTNATIQLCECGAPRPIRRRCTFPLKENVMFKVFIDGNDDRLRLENSAGRKVGWIRDRTFGFGGLASEKAALKAAVDAWRSLEKALQRGYPGRASRPVDESNVGLVQDGAYEWVADGFRPMARLLRPRTERNPEDSFALEFLAPSYATQHVTIAAAQAVWEALSEHIAPAPPNAARPATAPKQSPPPSGTFALGGR